MEIFYTKDSLQKHLKILKQKGQTIGLVPTMGALHKGHLSLLEISKQQTDISVCTIFVNPTQFTNADDLKNYPRPIKTDIAKLKTADCDVLFMPGIEEMYAANEQWHIELGDLEHLLEGKFRPGHYQGVTQIVYKLFTLVEPDKAFFGQKDYQQFLVINKMVEIFRLPIKLVMCPILREPDGLAMSSRNIHLSAEEHQNALILSRALWYIKDSFNGETLKDLLNKGRDMITAQNGVELEYFEVADAETLRPTNEQTAHIVALTAAKVGSTRLIDNMILR
ncbi:pantoate--beta-alanine ligase [Mucilaginibacter ginkgonis]|uniref:Pantothenate synthetase n=1 Tax=Mucilaginibacter ginkgonis TaxID=2682091 RepID=A0A6I4IN57_9SPHI|nr:pantoate--beta-alanine ligase [Mucilaginibacter ginkgonis]QQL49352.1 pantoate--beta-alanine ligase [Mucilaginibacter ginkgonis]